MMLHTLRPACGPSPVVGSWGKVQRGSLPGPAPGQAAVSDCRKACRHGCLSCRQETLLEETWQLVLLSDNPGQTGLSPLSRVFSRK